IPLPSEYGSLLDGDAGSYTRRQDAIPILLRLMLKDIPGRYGDYPRTDAFGQQLFMSVHSDADFASRGHEDHLGDSAGSVCEHVSAARHTGRRSILAPVQNWERLSRKHEH